MVVFWLFVGLLGIAVCLLLIIITVFLLVPNDKVGRMEPCRILQSDGFYRPEYYARFLGRRRWRSLKADGTPVVPGGISFFESIEEAEEAVRQYQDYHRKRAPSAEWTVVRQYSEGPGARPPGLSDEEWLAKMKADTAAFEEQLLKAREEERSDKTEAHIDGTNDHATAPAERA